MQSRIFNVFRQEFAEQRQVAYDYKGVYYMGCPTLSCIAPIIKKKYWSSYSKSNIRYTRVAVDIGNILTFLRSAMRPFALGLGILRLMTLAPELAPSDRLSKDD